MGLIDRDEHTSKRRGSGSNTVAIESVCKNDGGHLRKRLNPQLRPPILPLRVVISGWFCSGAPVCLEALGACSHTHIFIVVIILRLLTAV